MGRHLKVTDQDILSTLTRPKSMNSAADDLMLSPRSLRYRVRNLVNLGFVRETHNLRDMRQPVYVAIAGKTCLEAEA